MRRTSRSANATSSSTPPCTSSTWRRSPLCSSTAGCTPTGGSIRPVSAPPCWRHVDHPPCRPVRIPLPGACCDVGELRGDVGGVGRQLPHRDVSQELRPEALADGEQHRVVGVALELEEEAVERRAERREVTAGGVLLDLL